jgi:hypothetical protein
MGVAISNGKWHHDPIPESALVLMVAVHYTIVIRLKFPSLSSSSFSSPSIVGASSFVVVDNLLSVCIIVVECDHIRSSCYRNFNKINGIGSYSHV